MQRDRTAPDAVRAHAWTLLTAAALVAGAWWLRAPSIRYLAATLGATVLALGVALWLPRRAGRWALAATAATLAFGVMALRAQRSLARIETDWPRYRSALVARGAHAFLDALDGTTRALRATAASALAAPRDGTAAFHALGALVAGHPERGVVLYRGGTPSAWAGHMATHPDTMVAPLGTAFSPFYVTLYAAAVRGDARAVATAVVSAAPPGDALTEGLGNRIAGAVGLQAIEVAAPGAPGFDSAVVAYAPTGDTLLVARVLAPGREAARLLALEHARMTGSLLLAIALLLQLLAAWRVERAVGWRLVPLGVLVGGAALTPLSTLSSVSVVFDPTVYYAELGGALTANVGALMVVGGTVLLALLLVLRARARVPSRRLAVLLVLAVMAGGPPLLRALSAGVTPPSGGITDPLWLAWEIALFLPAAALLIIAAAAGSTIVGRARGLPAALAPALAVAAALAGPMVLDAPGVWPAWYPWVWIAAIGALALSRPHRRLVLAAAGVAALGAATLTWNAGVRGRTALANRDIAGLGITQPDVLAVLQRMADAEADAPAPATAAGLLRLYTASDLVGSGYPVVMQSWTAQDSLAASLALDPLALPDSGVRRAVAEARQRCVPVLRPVLGMPGLYTVLAIPNADGAVTTVIVAPRSGLIPENPFRALLGLAEREQGTPPYAIALLPLDPALTLTPGETRWYRSGGELHGDRLVQTARGPMRAHVEIELRPLMVLAQRGTLVVLLDLLVIALLWMLSAFPEGALGRWLRMHLVHRGRSYRARLTVVLFAFFLFPAASFALWSYQRLQSEDRQSRELLVRETLVDVVTDGGLARPGPPTAADGSPLFVYRDGELRQTSTPLLDALAPTGRFLASDVLRVMHGGREMFTAQLHELGDARALFGYLATTGPMEQPVVLAAPARGSEGIVDQRRRDLAVLVLFVTVLGAMGALALSRVASRALADPIGRLRGAALAIASGEREPPLPGRPPEEFAPVFNAFRRMAADLGASRGALESAQRRTTDVLRNVASGVVALAPDGTVSLANPRAEALLGRALPPGTAAGALAPALGERVRAFMAGGADEVDFELASDARQLQARLTRLTGGADGAVLTLDDVTELARAQRVLAWGEMARQVAHEIKNPLTPIRLGVQHLRRAYRDARADFDEILERNAERILAEIDRLDEIARSFSRYGTAPAERPPAERTDVAAIARDMVELERLGRGDVDWHLEGADAPLAAAARPDELREVLLNVLENARHAAARRVDVRCARRDGRVVLEVADDGRGIAAVVLPRIFEPHFSTRTAGSGLGLAISRQLVESWGGEIAIASAEGRGTTVRIELKGW